MARDEQALAGRNLQSHEAELQVLGEIQAARREEAEELARQSAAPEGAEEWDADAGLSHREWIGKHCKILTKPRPGQEAEVVPFTLNSSQLRADHLYEKLRRERGVARMYILKSRQIGFSTWYQARIYERIRRHPNTFALSLAHDNAGLSWIYQMCLRFLDHDEGHPPTRYSSLRQVWFDYPLNSRNAIAVAKGNAGTSQTIRMAHFSEFAKWLTAPLTWTSLGPAIEGADYVIETSGFEPEGLGSTARATWDEARAGRNGITAFFVAWHEHAEYTLPEDGRLYDEYMSKSQADLGWDTDEVDEEMSITSAFGLSPGQVAWRRYCICELLQAENPSLRVESFRQEYPNTEDEAWAKVQGRRVFNPVQVRSRRAAMSKDPIAVGQLEWMVEPLRDANGNCTNKRALYVGFVPDSTGPLSVYEFPPESADEYIPGRFIGSGDVAEGKGQRGDAGCGVVLDRMLRKVVCEWFSRDHDATLTGMEFAKMVYFWSVTRFAPEINAAGDATLREMVRMCGTGRLWSARRVDPGVVWLDYQRDHWGWHTGVKSKDFMVMRLIDYIREAPWVDPVRPFWDQALTVVRASNHSPELNGMDRVATRCILSAIEYLMVPLDRGRPATLKKKRRDYSGLRASPKPEEKQFRGTADYTNINWRTAGLSKRKP